MCFCFVPSGHDASQITLALGTAAAYPRACQALGAMLSKGALNPADITVLFKMFSSMDPPPVELVRVHFGPARVGDYFEFTLNLFHVFTWVNCWLFVHLDSCSSLPGSVHAVFV